ncbi:MAG: DUF3592 domain-containing protein [Rhodothermales bacterium]|nr:DUF3592 domain-containing protein [Rhodothermales bacterium]
MTSVPQNEVAVDSPTVKRVARMLWFAPVLLLALAVNQAFVARDVSTTLNEGIPAVATVTEYERVDRADVTFGYVSLNVVLSDGSVITKEKMSLPYTLLPGLEGETELPVIVSPGADQEVVIASIASTQWKIAAIQAAIAFVGSLLFGWGVFAWNRYLARQSA